MCRTAPTPQPERRRRRATAPTPQRERQRSSATAPTPQRERCDRTHSAAGALRPHPLRSGSAIGPPRGSQKQYTISLSALFSGMVLLMDLAAEDAYAVPKRRVQKVYSPKETMDLLGPQTPGCPPKPTPLPGRLHLALVGQDDGSLHPNSLKLLLFIIYFSFF